MLWRSSPQKKKKWQWMTDEWGRPTDGRYIFILLSFFVPVHSRFSAPRFRVPGMVCSRVESGTNDSGLLSRSLPLSPPPSLPLSLSLSRERMSVSRLLTRPPLPFSLCHWHLLPPLSHVLFSLFKNIPVISLCFCLFLPPVCHMFTCSHCLHNLLSVFCATINGVGLILTWMGT